VELSEHLFRHEYGRLVAALTRILGVHNLALAEDVVQDAFWRRSGSSCSCSRRQPPRSRRPARSRR
jgi:DNA-directed RNA polymerase specialized sigma24 family protein